MKQKALKQLKSKSLYKIILWIAFGVLVVYCALTLFSNTADISRLNAQAAECDSQYEQQLDENDKIKAILDSDSKDEYIEQKAREKGYVKDGETVFYDISSSK
jgi:cell division protein FtsB